MLHCPAIAAILANSFFVVLHVHFLFGATNEQPKAAGADDQNQATNIPQASALAHSGRIRDNLNRYIATTTPWAIHGETLLY